MPLIMFVSSSFNTYVNLPKKKSFATTSYIKVEWRKQTTRSLDQGYLRKKISLTSGKDQRKWASNYEGPYMVRKVFSGGALIVTKIDAEDLHWCEPRYHVVTQPTIKIEIWSRKAEIGSKGVCHDENLPQGTNTFGMK
jgi:hypothetical protein